VACASRLCDSAKRPTLLPSSVTAAAAGSGTAVQVPAAAVVHRREWVWANSLPGTASAHPLLWNAHLFDSTRQTH
jgi:hypothetical protein